MSAKSAFHLVVDLSYRPAWGLVKNDQIIFGETLSPGHKGEDLVEVLQQKLVDANCLLSLQSIAIGTGPGSFTGIRIGMAMAQGLSESLSAALYPFSSLQGIKAGLLKQSTPAFIAVPARKQTFYTCHTDQEEEKVYTEEQLGKMNFGTKTLAIFGGESALSLYPWAHRFEKIYDLQNQFDFLEVLKLARSKEPIDAADLKPNYLLLSAAEEKFNQK